MSGEGIFEALSGQILGNASSTETLVMVHGFGTDQTIWHNLIPVLSCCFKLVLFNLAFARNVSPGLYSAAKYSTFSAYADDVVCVLQELNLTKVHYLGHSMAAMIGCIAAIKEPQRFKQLILLGGSPMYLNDFATGYYGGFTLDEVNGLFAAMQSNYIGWCEAFPPEVIIMNNKSAITEFQNDLLSMDPATTLSCAKVVFLDDNRSYLPQVTTPTHILNSKYDVVVPGSVALYMKKQLGGTLTYTIIDSEGHFPMLTAPDLLLANLKPIL
ncbi:hypothetical protein Droror1_Dr00012693 [Drosera rotundifolia]